MKKIISHDNVLCSPKTGRRRLKQSKIITEKRLYKEMYEELQEAGLRERSRPQSESRAAELLKMTVMSPSSR